MNSDTVWIDSAEIIITERSKGTNSDSDTSLSSTTELRQKSTALSPSSTIILTLSQFCVRIVLNVMSTTTIPVVLPEDAIESTGRTSTVTAASCPPNKYDRSLSTGSHVIIRVHPLLYEYMTIQSQSGVTEGHCPSPSVGLDYNNNYNNDDDYHPEQTQLQSITIAPLPLPNYRHFPIIAQDDMIDESNIFVRSSWYMEYIGIPSSSTDMSSMIETLPPDSIIRIRIIYIYDTSRQECCEFVHVNGQSDSDQPKQAILLALFRRVISIGAVLLLPIISHFTNSQHGVLCYYLIQIQNINILPLPSRSSISSSHDKAVATLPIYDQQQLPPRHPTTTILYRIDAVNALNSNNCTIEIENFIDEFHVPIEITDNKEKHNRFIEDTEHRQPRSLWTSRNATGITLSDDCPGYNLLQAELLQLLQLSIIPLQLPSISAEIWLSEAAPTGVLVTGCAGVGKTRFISSICVRISFQLQSSSSTSTSSLCHYVSVHNLILLASWADEIVIIDAIDPPIDCVLLVLDDLHVLGSSDNNDNYIANNRECRLVLNSIVQVIDRINKNTSSCKCTVVGMGRDISHIPSELLKVGRLEKNLQMLPPSQSQREAILYYLLLGLKGYAAVDIEEEYAVCCRRWADLLATVTAGCVASDLRRICSDAWSNRLARYEMDTTDEERKKLTANDPEMKWPVSWYDLSEAVRNITPSQLALLDVTKPRDCLDLCPPDDWSRVHQISWETIAGYKNVKKRIYRTVVVPWRRQLTERGDSTEINTIIPPSGILFHGPSGCGKTIAACCLGSSLGVPMIKVRAADVLDKWLGGSEAAIRTLFTRARSAAPCILFFDEIDALASNRANSDGVTADVMSRLLSTLLNEMDGISSTHQSNVIIVACTNRLDSLDAALLRPGRLEEHILLTLPSSVDAQAILQQNFALTPIDKSIDLTRIAANLTMRSASGADINGICREAIFRAIRRCSPDYSTVSVTRDDIENAVAVIKL